MTDVAGWTDPRWLDTRPMQECRVTGCDRYSRIPSEIPLCPEHSVRVWHQVEKQLKRPAIIEAAANMYAERVRAQQIVERNKAKTNNPTKADLKAAGKNIFPLVEKTPEELAAAIAEDKAFEHDVYYVQVGDLIKIGYSSDLEKRLFSYGPTAKVLAHHYGTRADERDLHRTFRPFLAHGREWYTPAKVLMDHIAQMIERYGEPWCIPEWSKPKGHVTAQRRSSQAKPNGLSI